MPIKQFPEDLKHIKASQYTGTRSNTYLFTYISKEDEEYYGTVSVYARDADTAWSKLWNDHKVSEEDVVFAFEVKGNPEIKVLDL